MKNNIKLMISSATVCITVFAFGISADASEKPKITSTSTTKAITTLTDQESLALSQAAGRVLFHAEQAQVAIADKKKDEALKQISQGIKLINIIKGAVPQYKITTNIKSPGGSYKSSDIITQRYVIVSSNSFVENAVMPVIQRGKSQLSHHHKNAKAAVVDYSVARRMTATLDTLIAGRMLDVARSNVKAGKLDQAAKALLEIQSHGVILDSVEVPLPLASAVDNLYLAQAELSKKHYRNASATLTEASNDLKAYEKITVGAHGKNVHAIAKKIDALTSAINRQKDERKIKNIMEKSKDDIASWWSDAKSWINNK